NAHQARRITARAVIHRSTDRRNATGPSCRAATTPAVNRGGVQLDLRERLTSAGLGVLEMKSGFIVALERRWRIGRVELPLLGCQIPSQAVSLGTSSPPNPAMSPGRHQSKP